MIWTNDDGLIYGCMANIIDFLQVVVNVVMYFFGM